MRTSDHPKTVMMLAASLLLPASVLAGTDAGARADIEDRLERDKQLRGTVVSVHVQGDEATLEGTVETVSQKNRAEKLARKEVDGVVNRIVVQPAEPVKDKDLVEGVRRAVLGYSNLNIFDNIEFSVNRGAVFLEGSVSLPWKSPSIEARVAKVVGVRSIQNDIKTQSTSFFDTDLRRTLAERIYGDSRFYRYAHQPHPPIRIIVDRGNVVLAGVVNSPVEKAILGNIARGTLSFQVENRIRVDGDVPAEDQKEEADEENERII